MITSRCGVAVERCVVNTSSTRPRSPCNRGCACGCPARRTRSRLSGSPRSAVTSGRTARRRASASHTSSASGSIEGRGRPWFEQDQRRPRGVLGRTGPSALCRPAGWFSHDEMIDRRRGSGSFADVPVTWARWALHRTTASSRPFDVADPDTSSATAHRPTTPWPLRSDRDEPDDEPDSDGKGLARGRS